MRTSVVRLNRRGAAVACALVLAALGACSSNAGDGGADATSAGSVGVARDEAITAGQADTAGAVDADVSASGGNGGAAPAPGAAALPASVTAPRIVKNATLRIEVADGAFDASFAEVATIASSAGGFVASSTSSAADDDGAAGTLTVRIPSDQFDAVRAKLKALGDIQSEELSGDDVGGQLTDLEARLRNLRAQEEAIRALMSRTKDVPETLQIQSQLGTVREQIEQLAAQQARLTDAVSYATLTVQLTEPGASVVAKDDGPIARAFAKAVDGAEAMIAAVIVAVGYLVPVAVLGLVALVIARAIQRRRLPSAIVEHSS